MNVSFAGCGFLGLYHVGVASCFKSYAPQLYLYKVSGASAGAIAAVALLSDISLGEMTSNVLKVASEARARTLGPFSPSFNINQILYEGLNRVLPDDIHLKVQGRLHVSLTKVYDGSNILVNQFANKEEVIQVLLASCFIPFFSGMYPPTYRGAYVVDGGFSNNLPQDAKTVTVSPFSGPAHICPDQSLDFSLKGFYYVSVANTSIEVSKENLYRLGNVLLPPDPEVLARVCKQGFEDALRYLQKRYLISCTRCLTVNSNYRIEDDNEQDADLDGDYLDEHDYPENCKNHHFNCLECKLKREVAKESSIPENVWVVFENAISEAEAGITSWIRYIPASRIIRLLTLPAVLPLNIARRILGRLTSLLPRLSDDLKLRSAAEQLIEQLLAYMSSNGYILKHQQSHLARYTCEFNITQYGEEEEELFYDDRRDSVKDIFSMELTAELESNMEVDFPHNQAEAIKFQNENLNAAVSSSRAHSRINSRATSRASSRAVSRMGSRRDSYASLAGIDEDSPVLEHIRQVTQYQDTVLAFYYTDQDNQVKVTEIFDVTSTDPAMLSEDHSSHSSQCHASPSQVSLALSNIQDDLRHRHISGRSMSEHGRSRHGSGGSRHGSGGSECGFTSPRLVNTTPLIASGVKGDPECVDDYDGSASSPNSSFERSYSSPESSYSDPEADWKLDSRPTVS